MNRILILFCLFIIVSGCTKKNDPSYTYNYLDPAMIDFNFQPGSYWVYENEMLTQIDCTYLVKNEHGYYDYKPPQNNGHIVNEYHKLFYHDVLFPESFQGSDGYEEYIVTNEILRNYTPEVPGLPVNILFSLDPAYKHMDSLHVGNTTYFDIQKSIIDSNTYYYGRRYGVIKKIRLDSAHVLTTWNLVRSKIVIPGKMSD
jgi:hypothetical protein